MQRVYIDTADLITDRSWRQALDEKAPSTARAILDGWSSEITAPLHAITPDLDMGH